MPESPQPLPARSTGPEALAALRASLEELPPAVQELLRPMIADVEASFQRRRDFHRRIQDTLSDLRLEIQCLMFDLECTRRERGAQ